MRNKTIITAVEYNDYIVRDKIQKIIDLGKKYQLQDPRTWGLLAFAFMATAVTWRCAKAIQINFELQKKVVVIDEQNKVQSLQNETQKLKNEYLKSDEYKELSARRLFGKAAAGERVYIVPKEVALKYTSPKVAVKPNKITKAPLKLPTYQQNTQDWLDFFFHRSPKS